MLKKAFAFVILFAMVCFILCGCTPKVSDGGTESGAQLPALNTERGEQPIDNAASEAAPQKTEPNAPDNETDENSGVGSQAPEEVTDPINVQDSSEEPTEAPVIASEEDPDDDEVVSEFVVDGGDVIGFGGN